MLATVLALSGCGAGESAATAADGDAGPPRHGGDVVLGLEQEPACLNTALSCGSMYTTTLVTTPLLLPLVSVNDKMKRYPVLATDVPTRENGQVTMDGRKMIVRFTIRPEASWSDGIPVTCEDLEFTWKIHMDDRWMIISKVGWDSIDSIDCTDTKHAVVTFRKSYAPYLTTFGGALLPAHELEGKDFNSYWNDRITVSSGPFTFGEWKRNVSITLKRNPRWWNAGAQKRPYLDGLTYRFVSDTDTLKIQLRTGEVDWVNPPPDTNLIEELKTFPRSRYVSVPSGYWELLGFQTTSPPLDDVHVRRAIAYAVDRQQITDTVLRKQTVPLQSTLLPFVDPYATPAWERYKLDPEKVKQELTAAGWSRSGAFWTKDGKRLELTFKTTAGNVLRQKVAQLMQQQLQHAGISLIIKLELPSIFFSQSARTGQYQLGEWAWSSGLDPTQTTLFACDQIPGGDGETAGSNYSHYCNEEATALMHKADETPALAERSKMVHKVQQLMAEDLPVLPLYQRPDTIAFSRRLHGVSPAPIFSDTWNTYDWWVSGS